MVAHSCPGCRELSKQVAELTAQVAELTRKLDEAVRAGKRQAAPFRKGPTKPDPPAVRGPRAPPRPRPAGDRHAWGRPLPAAGDHVVHRGDPLAQRVRAGDVDRRPTRRAPVAVRRPPAGVGAPTAGGAGVRDPGEAPAEPLRA